MCQRPTKGDSGLFFDFAVASSPAVMPLLQLPWPVDLDPDRAAARFHPTTPAAPGQRSRLGPLVDEHGSRDNLSVDFYIA